MRARVGVLREGERGLLVSVDYSAGGRMQFRAEGTSVDDTIDRVMRWANAVLDHHERTELIGRVIEAMK